MSRNRIIIIRLQGGLGNQMFQYAAAKSLSIQTDSSLYFDTSLLDLNKDATDDFTPRKFDLNIFKNINNLLIEKINHTSFKIGKKVFSNRGLFSTRIQIYNEPHFHADKNYFNIQPPVVLTGYFNSEYYFKQIKDILLNDFNFPDINVDDNNFKIKKCIEENDFVAIHIRRGDYLKPKVTSYHGLCSLEYYQQAIEYFKKNNPMINLCFFSDDPQWVKDTFTKKYNNCIIIEGNTDENSWKDMYLMSLCKHHIIANSTFSWWGAWLSLHKDKMVFAPKKWFNEKSINSENVIPITWKVL